MNWRDLARDLILQDGRINEREAAVLRRHVLADRRVDKEEAEFLLGLRRGASVVHPEFDRFFLEVLKRAVLVDGQVSDAEARWLRQQVFTGAGSGLEGKLLEDLRREARSVGPEFEALYREHQPPRA